MLQTLLKNLKNADSITIGNDSANGKRASVVAVLRSKNSSKSYSNITELLKDGDGDELEIMFIRRAFSPRDRWSGHIAFPGGKQDKGETDRETVERETLEEIGLDLKSKDFQYLGRLNDRDVKAPASRRTLMVLCCFIYIQLNHNTPTMTLNEDEIQSIYWVPITNLVDSKVWEPIYFNISNHLFPKQVNALIGGFLEAAVGGFSFFGIPIDESYCEISTGKQVNLTAKKYPLWGLTLWMTSDLLTLMGYSPIAHKGSPRYSSWDVDGMISLLSLGKPRQLCTWLDRSNISCGLGIITAVRVSVAIGIISRLYLGKKFIWWIASKIY